MAICFSGVVSSFVFWSLLCFTRNFFYNFIFVCVSSISFIWTSRIFSLSKYLREEKTKRRERPHFAVCILQNTFLARAVSHVWIEKKRGRSLSINLKPFFHNKITTFEILMPGKILLLCKIDFYNFFCKYCKCSSCCCCHSIQDW